MIICTIYYHIMSDTDIYNVFLLYLATIQAVEDKQNVNSKQLTHRIQ